MSPDGRALYFADSPTRTIRVFELNEPEGTLGPSRVFAQTPEGAAPDGAAIDADGCLWSAHWGAGCVVRYTPDGRIDRTLRVPASQPTCVCFAGPDLDVLCVTTARDGLSDAALLGRAQRRGCVVIPGWCPGAARVGVPTMNSRALGQNLTYGIANELGIAIVTGVYSADNPIPIEAELCRKYGASRPVLREAVKMLTAKGLLGARPRRGTWVQPEGKWNLLDPDVLGWLLERKYSPALLIEFTEIRLAVEPGAATLAARAGRSGRKGCDSRRDLRMQAADRGDDDPLDSDIAFHVAVLAGQPQSILCSAHRAHRHGAALQHPHDESVQGREARQRRRSQESRRCDHGREGRRRVRPCAN